MPNLETGVSKLAHRDGRGDVGAILHGLLLLLSSSLFSASVKPDVEVGEELRRPELAVALETATRLSSSVARLLEFGLVNTPLQALDVVIDGSVAHALNRRGRRLLLLRSALGEESRRVRRCESGDADAILPIFQKSLGGAN
ncbi:hypothetical protein JX266_002548 [Neoarthrinium moseri]|nr:hypothetical protein JX266_002548 [Neoarthrinium moseri]